MPLRPPELPGVGCFAGFQKPLYADLRNWLILQPTRAAFRGFRKHMFLGRLQPHSYRRVGIGSTFVVSRAAKIKRATVWGRPRPSSAVANFPEAGWSGHPPEELSGLFVPPGSAVSAVPVNYALSKRRTRPNLSRRCNSPGHYGLGAMTWPLHGQPPLENKPLHLLCTDIPS